MHSYDEFLSDAFSLSLWCTSCRLHFDATQRVGERVLAVFIIIETLKLSMLGAWQCSASERDSESERERGAWMLASIYILKKNKHVIYEFNLHTTSAFYRRFLLPSSLPIESNWLSQTDWVDWQALVARSPSSTAGNYEDSFSAAQCSSTDSITFTCLNRRWKKAAGNRPKWTWKSFV